VRQVLSATLQDVIAARTAPSVAARQLLNLFERSQEQT